MNPGNESTADGASASPLPITAPQAPRQETAPHNLFTQDEVLEALRLLGHGLSVHQRQRVLVYWKNGAKRLMTIEEFTRVVDIQDVHGLYNSLDYDDGSRLSGRLIDRPDAGQFSVEGDGQALAAAYACLDSLKPLRPQRAKLRGFFGGSGFYRFLFRFSAVMFVILVGLLGAQAVSGGLSSITVSPTQIVLVLGSSVVMSIILIVVLGNLKTRLGGTRLARRHEVESKILTAEVGVLAAVIGIPIALLGLVIAAVGLL